MRLVTGLCAALALAAPCAAHAASLEINNAVVRVTVVPEARNDIKVEVVSPNARLPLEVVVEGDRTVVRGGLDRRLTDCRRQSVKVRGVGDVDFREMPQIVVHTPMDVEIRETGRNGSAVYGTLGRATNVKLGHTGCGEWKIDDVAGMLDVNASGVGQLRMASAGSLRLVMSGAAHADAASVRNGADIRLSGAGGVDVGSTSGPLDAHVSGTGGVKIGGGQVKAMVASVSGVGNVHFGGTAETLDARVSGVGSIQARRVTGSVSKRVSGVGSISVG